MEQDGPGSACIGQRRSVSRLRCAIRFSVAITSLNAPDKRPAVNLRADSRHSLAAALKEAYSSYRAATFGRWQLVRSQREPGLDSDDGKITQNRNGRPTDSQNPNRMFELTDKGHPFMEDSVAAGHPFYLQLWHYAVHGPNQSLPESLCRWRTRPRGRPRGACDRPRQRPARRDQSGAPSPQ